MLHRICTFFKTDARIPLEPLHEIKAQTANALIHPELLDYFGPQETDISSDIFPTGFLRFSRHSFVEKNRFVQGLIFVYQRDFQMLLRGMEAKEAIAGQGLDKNTKTLSSGALSSPKRAVLQCWLFGVALRHVLLVIFHRPLLLKIIFGLAIAQELFLNMLIARA